MNQVKVIVSSVLTIFIMLIVQRLVAETKPHVKESVIALELNKKLGPKLLPIKFNEVSTIKPKFDFIIDLHTSNSNVGSVAMISGIEYDLHALRLAYHLSQTFPGIRITSSIGEKVYLTHDILHNYLY